MEKTNTPDSQQSGFDIHNHASLLLKLMPLQGLARVVSWHIISWAILDIQVLLLDTICNKEKTDVNVSGSLTRTLFTILLQQNSTCVILEDGSSGFIALGLQKVPGPHCLDHNIVCRDEFRFG